MTRMTRVKMRQWTSISGKIICNPNHLCLSNRTTKPLSCVEKKGLPNLSAEISQYSVNEFARYNKYCTAFMAVCIPMWPQSNYYSLYLCPLRHQGRKPSVLLPKKPPSLNLLWDMYICLCLPPQQSLFYDRSVICSEQGESRILRKILQVNADGSRLDMTLCSSTVYLLLQLRQHSSPGDEHHCLVGKIDACVFIWCKPCCMWLWLTAAQYSYS